MSRAAILAALQSGVMRAQAAGLSHAQLAATAAFSGETQALRLRAVEDRCKRKSGPLVAAPRALWNGWASMRTTVALRKMRDSAGPKVRIVRPSFMLRQAINKPGYAAEKARE